MLIKNYSLRLLLLIKLNQSFINPSNFFECINKLSKKTKLAD